MPPLDPSRYRLDPPPEDQRADPKAWLAALQNARAQLQHQQGRVLNLELLSRHGPAAWRAQAKSCHASARFLASEAGAAAEAVVQSNRRRKLQQLAAGKELQELEDDWGRALRGVAEVGAACAALEQEVGALAAVARSEGRAKEAERAEEALEEARRIGGGEDAGRKERQGEEADAMDE
jgi:pre-mRNA-splicing factor SPF27